MADRIVVIESDDYRQNRARALADPIVQGMAVGLKEVPLDQLAHEDGSPRFEFMQAANGEYAKRGGEAFAHIGCIAEAILLILNPPDFSADPLQAEADKPENSDSGRIRKQVTGA